MPENATATSSGWECNIGFSKDGKSCNKIEESKGYITELNNIKELLYTFSAVKQMNTPVLVHVYTQKGKRCQLAEKDAIKYYSLPGKIKRKNGSIIPDYSKTFGYSIAQLADKNDKIICVTAAMEIGTGMSSFIEKYPDRYIDVGIAEEHAVTYSAGLSAAGFKPIIAIYSTFMQRAYDQIFHDSLLQKLPVIYCMDRSGLVGPDGPTHHGHQDLSSMRLLPEMSIIELSSNDLAQKAVNFAFENNGPLYIRLDKGPFPEWKEYNIDFSKGYRIIQPLSKLNIVTNGYMTRTALKVADTLIAEGIDCGVVDLFRVKPFPEEFYEEVISPSKKIVSIEESCKTGGLGSALSELIAQNL